MPSHNHRIGLGSSGSKNMADNGSGSAHLDSSFTGGDQAHNNTHPIVITHVWERIG